MKKKILILVTLLLLTCSCTFKKEEEKQSILSYNGQEFYEEDIYELYGEEGFNYLINKIDKELTKKETKEYKEEISEEIDSMIEEYETYYGEDLEDTISTYYGYDLSEFKDNLYYQSALGIYITEIYLSKKDLSEEYYDNNESRVVIEAKQYIREKNKVKFNNKTLQEQYEKYQKKELDSIPEEVKETKTELSKKLKDITVEEIQNKIYNSDSFILVISRSDCSHCIKYLPILSEVLEDYNITAYRIELDKLNEEDMKYIEELFEGVTGTPTTLFIKNGVEEKDQRLVGSREYSEIEKVFKNNKFIK